MSLGRRLQQLELKTKLNSKQPGCDVSLFIVIPEELKHGQFDSNTYRPTAEELEKFLKYLKANGHCRDCKGSCAVDWAPDGFKNHTLLGERSSLSPTPKIFTMFCANAEIPVLTRRLMNGEREPNK